MGRKTRLVKLAGDAWLARAGGPNAIAARQRERLAATLARAREIPLYQRLWAGLPEDAGLDALTPMTKAVWVEGFEESIDDPQVTRDALWSYMQDLTRVGAPWLGRYTVCRSSGVMGLKALFVHDQDAMDVYWTLWLTRGWLPWLGLSGTARMAARGARSVHLVVTNGHFASAAFIRRDSPLGAIADARSATLSIVKPVGRLARALDHWQPVVLVGYPTVLEQLALRQRSGELSLDLVLAVSVSEWVEPGARRVIEEAFGCPLKDSYAASEFLALGFECPEGWLHVNDDWAVLEPVDRDMRPVPPGEPSDTALVTNLANRAQPIVRYDIEDRVTRRADPCPCGSPFTAVRLEGRQNEVLHYEDAGGRRVALQPMALITLVGGVPGVNMGSQFVQTDPRELALRIGFRPDADPDRTWAEVERRLRAHLRDAGLSHVAVVRSPIPPGRDPRTGKLRKLWSELPVGVA